MAESLICNGEAPAFCGARWPVELLGGSQAPRRAVCGTRGSLRTMHGGGRAASQRHYFANKGLSSQGYGFSSGHVWMQELDYKES